MALCCHPGVQHMIRHSRGLLQRWQAAVVSQSKLCNTAINCRLTRSAARPRQVLTWALCSRAEIFDNLRQPDDGASAVAIGNPATAEFQVCRKTLLAGAPADDLALTFPTSAESVTGV